MSNEDYLRWRPISDTPPKDGRTIWIAVRGQVVACKAYWNIFPGNACGWDSNNEFISENRVYAWRHQEKIPECPSVNDIRTQLSRTAVPAASM